MKIIQKLGVMIITTIFLFLAACNAQQNYAQVLNSWNNAGIDDLFRIWGYPDRIDKLTNGRKILTYSRVGEDGNLHADCQTFFELNQANRVVNVSFKGDHCVANSGFVQTRTFRSY